MDPQQQRRRRIRVPGAQQIAASFINQRLDEIYQEQPPDYHGQEKWRLQSLAVRRLVKRYAYTQREEASVVKQLKRHQVHVYMSHGKPVAYVDHDLTNGRVRQFTSAKEARKLRVKALRTRVAFDLLGLSPAVTKKYLKKLQAELAKM